MDIGACWVWIERLEGPLASTYEFELELATNGKATQVSQSGTRVHHDAPKALKWHEKKRLLDGFVLDYEGKDSYGKMARVVVVRRKVGRAHIRCHARKADTSCVKPVCLALQPLD